MTTLRKNLDISDEITGNTGKSIISFMSKSDTLFGKSFQEYYKKNPENIRKNLKQGNCKKQIFAQYEKIYGMVTWENLVITISRSSIKAWDSVTGENEWTYSGNLELGERLWVANNKIICAGREESGEKSYTYGESFILVLDAETGRTSSKIKYPVHHHFVTVANNEIIGRINSINSHGYIICWDLSGNVTRKIPSSTESSMCNKLLANENYIVDINDNNITIVNRNNNKPLDLIAVEYIASATILNNLLICGLSSYKSSSPDIIVVDMEQGKKVYEHKTSGLFDNGSFKNCGYIGSVVAKNNMVFMLHNDSDSKSCYLVAVDLDLKSGTLLDISQPYSPYMYLAIQDEYLFIRSYAFFNRPETSNLRILNSETLEEITKMEIPNFYSAKWDKGNLLVSSGGSLIKRDYKVLHQKGEIPVNSNSQEETWGFKRF